jgi:hypothetical protein
VSAPSIRGRGLAGAGLFPRGRSQFLQGHEMLKRLSVAAFGGGG